MIKVVKDGVRMAAMDKNQLAAFLNNGWNIVETVTDETVITTADKKVYTKTEINRMSTADLQALATEQGISGAELISGSELKKLLIEKFGL